MIKLLMGSCIVTKSCGIFELFDWGSIFKLKFLGKLLANERNQFFVLKFKHF